MKKIYTLMTCAIMLSGSLVVFALADNVVAMIIFAVILLIYMSGSLTIQFKDIWILTYPAFIMATISSLFAIMHNILYDFSLFSWLIPLITAIVVIVIYFFIFLKMGEYQRKKFVNLASDITIIIQGMPILFMMILVVGISLFFNNLIKQIYLDEKPWIFIYIISALIIVYSIFAIIKRNINYIRNNILNIRIKNPKLFSCINLIPLIIWSGLIIVISFILADKRSVADISLLCYLGYIPYIVNVRNYSQKYLYNKINISNLNVVNDDNFTDFNNNFSNNRDLDNVIDIEVDDNK